MYNDVIFSGFGGQGVLFTGQLLAYAAMDAGLHVTWIPSYGPEMRGGTAHCTVVVSDSPIGSPLVRRPRNVVAFNNPSFEKYLPQLSPDGTLVYNSSLITPSSARTDIQLVAVPANDLAAELGEARLLNMVLLGALLARAPILPLATLERALATHTAERHRALLAPNLQALRRAYEYAGGC